MNEAPGELYETWHDIDPEHEIDPKLMARFIGEGDMTAASMYPQMIRLGQLYGGHIPEAALVLDDLMSEGVVPVKDSEVPGGVNAVPLAELATLLGATGRDPGDTADMLHLLHAGGMLIVHQETYDDVPQGPVPMVRIAIDQPTASGDGGWAFMDELTSADRDRLTDELERFAAGEGKA